MLLPWPLIVLALLLPTACFGTVVSFDDVPAAPLSDFVPNDYAGLAWDSSWRYWTGNEFYTPHSSPHLAYFVIAEVGNDHGFNFPAPVVFDGAWFSGPAFGEATVRFDLFLDGNPVGSSAQLALVTTPTFLASGYSDLVNRVQIHIDVGLASWTLDDVTYTPTPEPATLSLLGAGIALIVLRRRLSFSA